ncbi:unnamed protein product [Anisakis simplex]|uniref:16S rRNA methyltransferase n=1 Tax=Anisakis simplex TaxID=6269 RepID=A0A0M3JPI9_ANISI|nr:unnamed protein product [Anisakis simplex]
MILVHQSIPSRTILNEREEKVLLETDGYDHGRVKEVGADVAAAEWIVRCEGKVR